VRAATTTLMVVETGAFALQGALQARRLFENLAANLARPFDLRVLATRFDRSAPLSREILVAMQARFGRAMLDTVVRRDAVLREAAAYGVPARRLEPASRGALDHDSLARELLALERRSLAARPLAPSAALRGAQPHFASGSPTD